MSDLTEKWKAGELEVGWYYILNLNNVVRIEEANVWVGRYEKPFVGFDDDSGIKEVLAPVPSYDELQDMKEYLDYSINNRNQLTIQISRWIDKIDEEKEENARLKELLKECQTILQETKKDRGVYFNNLHLTDVLTEIEEVLK